jgi:hypothetical protein
MKTLILNRILSFSIRKAPFGAWGLLLLAWLGCHFGAFAQSDVDALRLSMQYSSGNARNMGLGNVMSSVGGDMSAIHTNPAALGRISSTEISITPAVSIFNSNSDYIGNHSEDTKLKFSLYNISAVFSRKYATGNSGNWGNIKFGISYNNLANLNQNFFISGFNSHNSLADKYYELLDQYAFTTNDLENMFPFDASLGYHTDLVYFDDEDSRIYTSINNGNVQQDIIIQRKGYLGEFAFAVASTYNAADDKKVHIGATLGIPTVNFTEKTVHRETDTPDSSFSFNFFEQTSAYRIHGFGLNLKLGLLAELPKNLRFSFAFHTPSILFIDDAFNAGIYADYDTYTAEAESPEGVMEYNLRLPWRLQTGLSYVFKYGFAAMEYELSNAGASKFRYKDANSPMKGEEREMNQTISDKYKAFHTLKLGVEGRIDPIRIRAGVQMQTSPFDKNAVGNSQPQRNFIYSAGIGFRKNKFYTDFAYQFVKGKDSYTPYTLQNEAPEYQYTAENAFKRSVIALTLGYKF